MHKIPSLLKIITLIFLILSLASCSSRPVYFNCSDIREKETFAGDMGFDELTREEVNYLDSHCR